MASSEPKRKDEIVIDQAVENESALPMRDPVVLSCGGMYIPQSRGVSPRGPAFRILNVLNEREPTKVISGTVPRNILREILAKECMN